MEKITKCDRDHMYLYFNDCGESVMDFGGFFAPESTSY
ncbi:Hypothetical protein CPI37_1332 [Corynebacterium pseudotuberculosis]|nr:Hypothetical protein CPI37_1332 [Corynebacterium pseudotuberculosis]